VTRSDKAVAVRVAPMRWWHIEEILPIEADLFGVEQWSAGMFWNELASGYFYVVALDERNQVDGYGGLAVSGPDEAWVQNIAVRRNAQRGGIGRALLTALLDQARSSGVSAVLLEVAVDNGPAQTLYEAYGFVGVGVRKGYYQPTNTDALVMRLELT
jgi:[ribosomal protein S18]-alanine N-acetyltransferase